MHTPLAGAPLSRVVHEDLPHQPRRDPEEMGAILPLNVSPVDQPQIGLVHECRRLERVIAALTPHVRGRNTAQLALDTNHEALLLRSRPGPPPSQEAG